MPILKPVTDEEIDKAVFGSLMKETPFEVWSIARNNRRIASHFKREGAWEVFEWGDGMCLHTGIAGDGAVFRKNCARCRQEFQKELGL